MPVILKYYPDGVEILVTGLTTMQELVDANHEFYAHEYEDGFKFQLLDATEAEISDLTGARLQEIADIDLDHMLGMREHFVAIACTKSVYFEMSRMWASMASNPALRSLLTRSRADAVAWLRENGFNVG
jgi:hypothetical protein